MYDVDSVIPASLQEYIDGIIEALPDKGRASKITHLLASKLKCFQPVDLYPEKNESLQNWVESILVRDKQAKINIILGESRGDRVLRKQRKGRDRSMTVSGTSDGVGVAIAVAGIIQNAGGQARKILIDGGLDEWDQSVNEADKSHLIIIGTGEMNIFSTFLHGLVESFFFGDSFWPPDSRTLGDELNLGNPPTCYHRNPEGDTIYHYGATFLLKNPWNPDFRLLWIAGLTGHASMSGCHQVSLNWQDYPEASLATGVVFRRRDIASALEVKPEAWLIRENTIQKWEKASSKPVNSLKSYEIKKPEEKVTLINNKKTRIFVSYAHDDRKYFSSMIKYISVPLETAGFDLWHDTQIEIGDLWDEKIKENIAQTDIALVLVSQHFLNSPYCRKIEITNFLELRKEKGLRIFPVILLPCDWKSHKWLSETQFLPSDGKTLGEHFSGKVKNAKLYNEILTNLREFVK